MRGRWDVPKGDKKKLSLVAESYITLLLGRAFSHSPKLSFIVGVPSIEVANTKIT